MITLETLKPTQDLLKVIQNKSYRLIFKQVSFL